MGVDNGGSWQDTVSLLRLVKNDYEVARKQLEIAYETLSERERMANQRLAQALLLGGGYSTLCLVSVGSSITSSQIGRVILGEAVSYKKLPRALKLDVRCLERLEAYSGSQKLDHWQNANAKSLFKLFMTRPREPVVKDIILEYLWPECNPRTANNNLRVTIYGLRKTLNRLLDQKENFPSIIYRSGSYELNPEIELWTDVEQFEQHYATGRRLEREGNSAAAIAEFEMAEALYRGDYLEEEPYDDRTLIRREALKDTYLIIMGKIADYLLQIRDYEGSIIYSQKIIAKDNCREDSYRRLMRCYSRLGNRNRAMRWYEICCQAIQADLDASPEQETVHLYRRLFRDDNI